MGIDIHQSAIVRVGAEIGEGSIIGPFCIIGDKVKLGKNVHLMGNVFIEGDTFIDDGTIVFPFAVIGVASQDLKYKGEDTKVCIGKNNKIREHATIHRATNDGSGVTTIGDNCLIMVGSHVAHDVLLGNGVIIANNVLLAGHVVVEDGVTIGGGSAIHQFCRVGEHAFIGGLSGVVGDIVPYALYTGIREEGEINGINLVGLRRKGYSLEDTQAIRSCYDIIFSKDASLKDNIVKAKSVYVNNKKVMRVINFVDSEKSRSLCRNYRNSK